MQQNTKQRIVGTVVLLALALEHLAVEVYLHHLLFQDLIIIILRKTPLLI